MNRKSELPEMMNVMVRKPKLLKRKRKQWHIFRETGSTVDCKKNLEKQENKRSGI